MRLIKYLLFLIIGIIIFLLLNSRETFNVGVPWMAFRPDFRDQIDQGVRIDKGVNFPGGGGVPMYSSFNEAAIAVTRSGNPRNNAIYHVVDGQVDDVYKLDLEGCYSPHNRISGTISTESLWDRENQENKETKPLVPRNNLLVTRVSNNYLGDTDMEIDDEDNNQKLYNHGDSITYSCDTDKTKSRDAHTLICKRRRKFVLSCHGNIREGDIKTVVPPSFQLMLYKPGIWGCIRMANYGIKVVLESILFQSQGTVYPTILESLPYRETLLQIHNPDSIRVQKNREYLQLLDDSLEEDHRPLHELVYSEMETMNSGRLILAMEHYLGLSDLDIDNDIATYCLDPPQWPGVFYCFYTNNEAFIHSITRISTLEHLYNPFLVEAAILFDSKNSELYDHFYDSEIYTLRRTDISTREWTVSMPIYTDQIEYALLQTKTFDEPTMPDGSPWCLDLLGDDGQPKRDGNGNTCRYYEADGVSLTSEVRCHLQGDDNNGGNGKAKELCCACKGGSLYDSDSGSAEIRQSALNLRDLISTELGKHATNMELNSDGKFVDRNGALKPLYFSQCKLTPKAGFVEFLNRKVKSILDGSCVEVVPNYLTPTFLADSDRSIRLFGDDHSQPVKLPLLYLDLYCINGFIHPSAPEEGQTDYRLDLAAGAYRSEDLRAVIIDIVLQIYEGSQIPIGRNLEDFKYYMLFRQNMSLEKGYTLTECSERLRELYSNKSILRAGVGRVTTGIFARTERVRMNQSTTIIGGNILHQVWNRYGYDYNLEGDRHTGYPTYGIDAEVVMILAKLFRTELGESVDMHIITCIEGEDTPYDTPHSVKYVKKAGYWGCNDTPNYVEPVTDKTCGDYMENPQECIESTNGANDNCCVCKMVQNTRDDKDVGPVCQVRQCEQSLGDMRSCLEPRGMSIDQGDWELPNQWKPLRREGPDNFNPRLMSHDETSYSYISEGDDYGKIERNEERRESPEIIVKCQVQGSGDDAITGTDILATDTFACNVAHADDDGLANYSGDPSCPAFQLSLSIRDEQYFGGCPGSISEAVPPTTCAASVTSW